MTKKVQSAERPVNQGQVIEMQISGYGHEGEGVGRYQDFTLFIPGALQGEKVRIRVTEVKKNFARGKVVEVLQSAAERTEAPCSVYQDCGGCQLQHLDYPAQLAMKRQRVVDALERIGGLENVAVHPVIGMDEPWYYRNKVQYPLGLGTEGAAEMGFYRQGSHQIVPMSGCRLQPEEMNQIAAAILKGVREQRISIYNEQTGTGLLRHVLLRKAFGTGEIMVVLITTAQRVPGIEVLADGLTKNFGAIKSIVQNLNVSRGNVVLGHQTRLLWGNATITDELDGLRFKISPRSFFQVNPFQTRVLYNKAVEYTDLSGGETVVDAYCGVGSLTLYLARQAKAVYGIEVVPEAIRDAMENAELNQFKNTKFLVGETEKLLPELVAQGIHFDIGVVDPPRSGCEPAVLESFAANGVKRIVYVSCNPSTLARDLKVLGQLGYQTVEIQPVDMFPQTHHVECIAKICRNNNG